MKAIVLYGSPRINGNTYSVLKEIVRILIRWNVTCEEIYLSDIRGQACQGCNYCKKTYNCIFEDEYSIIIRKIIKSDFLIIGSPVYFGGVTSQIKLLIDRFQLLYNNQNKICKSLNILFITTAAEKNISVFDGIKLTLKYLKYIFRTEKCELICIGDVEEKQEMWNKIDKTKLLDKIDTYVKDIVQIQSVG